MTIGERLVKERKKLGLTQEDLSEKIGISRQAISKWESDLSLPDSDNLIKLSKLFNCSLDYLLRGDEGGKENEDGLSFSFRVSRTKEKHSEKTILGFPLWSIGVNAKGFFALGMKAEGIFTLGLLSFGIFSMGLLSIGLVAFGTLALGLLSLGVFSFGLLLSLGAISFSLIYAIGAIAIAPLSRGALSIGQVAIGALSRGKWFAYGDDAKALIAIAKSEVNGTYAYPLPLKNGEGEYIFALLSERIPSFLKWTLSAVKGVLGI